MPLLRRPKTHLRRLSYALLALWLTPTLILAAAPTEQDIKETAAWFDSLGWPDLSGKPYIEITLGQGRIDSKKVDGPKIRGFVLSENDQEYHIFSDGTQLHGASPWPSFGSHVAWPACEQIIKKSAPTSPPESEVKARVLDLPATVDELLASFRQPLSEDDYHNDRFGRKISNRTSLFILARFCTRSNHADLAALLDAVLPELSLADSPLRYEENSSFRNSVERELAQSLMWKAVVDCGNTTVTRPQLLAEFQRIVHDFPASEHHTRAGAMADMLETMVTEDEAHARMVKPTEHMTVEEKVHELIFQLRDQNGHQWSQPGSCDIFGDMFQEGGSTPAHQLVAIGFPAVPALIEALNDKRLTRSVGYHRDFYFSHFVLSVGDCAEAVLARIAHRNFWVSQTTSGAMQKDGETDKTRREVEAWWTEVGKKGEVAVLEDGVRAGGDDSYTQAQQLAKVNPEACLAVLHAGIENATSSWIRSNLIRTLASLPSDRVPDALRYQLSHCKSPEGRIAAAAALIDRGDSKGVADMIAEWKKRSPLARKKPKENGGAIFDRDEILETLIEFLGGCGHLDATNALAERFADLPPALKFKVIDAVLNPDSGRFLFTEKKIAMPPEVQSLGEKIAITALEDRTLRVGTSGSFSAISYRNPRVCDYAAIQLTVHSPKRYSFKWSPAKSDRDAQILQMQNVWRATQNLPPLAAPGRPAANSEAKEPNEIATLGWSGGPALDLPLTEGKLLTAEAVVNSLVRLFRETPKEDIGFTFTAERGAGQVGFLVKIEWKAGKSSKSRKGFWNHDYDVSLGETSLTNSSGSSDFSYLTDAKEYADWSRAVAKALAGDPLEPVSIMYDSRIEGSEAK